MLTTTRNVTVAATTTRADHGLDCVAVDPQRDPRLAAARRAACGGHLVHLHEDEGFMIEALADWFVEGIAARRACIAVATAAQSLALAEALLRRGQDAAALRAAGVLLEVDAHEALLEVCVAEHPDPVHFAAYFGDLVATAGGGPQAVRVFSSLATLLLQQGMPEQADRLEACWDELSGRLGFELYCAYPIASFGSEANGRYFRDICDRHQAVIPAESFLALEDETARNRAAVALQQKALALEDETARRMREQARVRQRDERLRLLSELSQDATWVNRDGRIVEVNEVCLELLGAAHEWQVVGRSPFDFIHPDWHDVVRGRIDALLAGYGDVPPQRIRLLRLDGRDVDAIVSAASYDDDGEPAIQVVLRDARRVATEPGAAHLDETTGLPDRSGFAAALAAALEEATRDGRQVAVLHVDLDRFKLVNDTLGHETGDEILRQASARLKRAVRAGNVLARFGGDEFVLFAVGEDAEREGRRVAASIIAAFHEPFAAAERMIFSTLSIGVALHPRDGAGAHELMRAADLALHVSKQSGGNVATFFRPALAADSLARLDLENRLHRALDQDELRLCYQPIYDVATGRIVAVEALLRWFPTDGPAMMPAEFIPVAEETGLIQPIGDWVLRTACTQVRAWQRRCPELAGLRVHVNVSPRQLRDMDPRGSVRRFLEESGLPATCLTLELTESTFLKDFEPTLRNLEQLREMGVRLSIDDFGTGYSCLDYLRRLPIDELKIDRSFVHDIGRDPSNAALVGAILAMAQALGLSVVAEGVENWEQLETLRDKGCRRVQGYGLGRPMFAADALAFLEARAATPAAGFTAAALARP